MTEVLALHPLRLEASCLVVNNATPPAFLAIDPNAVLSSPRPVALIAADATKNGMRIQ